MKVLSLFANVGFSEYYFKQIGFDVVVANELEEDRCAFYKTLNPNTPSVICGDICKQNIQNKIINACHTYGPIDLIVATPPCQGMSIANAQRASDDIRNTLIVQTMNIFKRLQPKYMLIENVPRMEKTYINYSGKARTIADFIISRLNALKNQDYQCHFKVLDSQNFLTAQSRKRLISLISPKGVWRHPEPSKNILTLKNAIGHLPSLESGERSRLKWHFANKHNDRHITWMKHTSEGQTAFNNEVHYPSKDGRKISGFATTYKRMNWDKPAPTVTMTNGSISSQNNVHPGVDLGGGIQSDARALSIRELLLVCGLPEDCFDDPKYESYSPNFIRRIMGEMFPPLMSKLIISEINKIPQ